tara:strand:+ start:1313 stop:1915 length:603 start_codon:yes stop_codon:yes gene_type:complete
MSKGRHSTREKRARRYFRGGKMPDGLELYPLNGGKLEIMQDIMAATSDDELDEDNLGNCMFMLYASKYNEIKDMDLDDLAEAGREIALNATLEDRQAAEEVIVSDFDALSASIATNPKQVARMTEEHNHSGGRSSSGQDSHLGTPEKKSMMSLQSRSSRLVSQTSTPAKKKETLSNGQTQTGERLREPEESLRNSSAVTG